MGVNRATTSWWTSRLMEKALGRKSRSFVLCLAHILVNSLNWNCVPLLVDTSSFADIVLKRWAHPLSMKNGHFSRLLQLCGGGAMDLTFRHISHGEGATCFCRL